MRQDFQPRGTDSVSATITEEGIRVTQDHVRLYSVRQRYIGLDGTSQDCELCRVYKCSCTNENHRVVWYCIRSHSVREGQIAQDRVVSCIQFIVFMAFVLEEKQARRGQDKVRQNCSSYQQTYMRLPLFPCTSVCVFTVASSFPFPCFSPSPVLPLPVTYHFPYFIFSSFPSLPPFPSSSFFSLPLAFLPFLLYFCVFVFLPVSILFICLSTHHCLEIVKIVCRYIAVFHLSVFQGVTMYEFSFILYLAFTIELLPGV